jgi:hypothetical protein
MMKHPVSGVMTPVFWDRLANIFASRQLTSQGRALHPKLSQRVFACATDGSTAPLMVVALATAFFSQKMMHIDETSIECLRDVVGDVFFSSSTAAERERDALSLEAVLPLKVLTYFVDPLEFVILVLYFSFFHLQFLDHFQCNVMAGWSWWCVSVQQKVMDLFINVCNGRDTRAERRLGFNGAKVYSRDSWGSPGTTVKVDDLRNYGCFFEQMKIDILQSQVFNAHGKMVSGCTQFRNGITYQTNAAFQNICFGLPSLLFHYAQICPGGTIFLGDITTDHNERHFNNLKASGAKTIEQLTQAESRGNYHNVLLSKHFVETGIRNIQKFKRKSGSGNSERETDENLHMSVAGRDGDLDDAGATGGGEGEQVRKKRKGLLRPLRVSVDLTKIPSPRVRPKGQRKRLRQGPKCLRAVAGDGLHVAPCGL